MYQNGGQGINITEYFNKIHKDCSAIDCFCRTAMLAFGSLNKWMFIMRNSLLAAAICAGTMLLIGSPAYAQATRTWVSGVGDDANPCSRTAPCKTFAGAISKTAAGGEIDALDPGGFGAVTITKSISIEAEGVIAGVLVSGTNGIIIAAGAGDQVVL